MPPPPSNTRPHQRPHDLQPHGGSLHDPNPNTLATTSSEHSGEPLQRRVIGYDVSQAIGSHALAPRHPNTQTVVIDESTVVPGATESSTAAWRSTTALWWAPEWSGWCRAPKSTNRLGLA